MSTTTTKLILFVISVILNEHWSMFTQAIAFDEVSTLQIWITVSSLATKSHQSDGRPLLLFRQIELNWINAPLDDSHDFIGLYLDTPPERLEHAAPVHVHRLQGRMSGKTTTEYYLPVINFMNESLPVASSLEDTHYELEADSEDGDDQPTVGRWHEFDERSLAQGQRRRRKSPTQATVQVRGALASDECLGYCAAYHSQGRVLATHCLKTNPNWMRDTRTTTRALPSLMLPGTHNSATYPRTLDKSVLQIINKYQINQDESVFNQLVYGIRYLDLRVGFSRVKQRPEEFWIYHDIFRTDNSLDEVLAQVRLFLEMTSHEIIVMDFHRFTVGFQNENSQTQRERHAKLLEKLFNQLGDFIIPSYLGQHAPLNEYISMGKRLVVGYANRGQLLGPLASEQSSPYGFYTAAGAASSGPKQQVRDIDEPEPGGDSAREVEVKSGAESEPLELESQADRRVGTRIYNRLKSLKLVARSFSRRSIRRGDSNHADAPDEPVELAEALAASPSAQSPTDVSKRQPTLANRYTAKKKQQWQSLRPKSSAQTLTFRSQLEDKADGPSQEAAALAALPARLALLFPPVRHLWPNKDTLDGLAQYLNETTCRKYFGELRALMTELTPTVFGAISDKYDGNRRLADVANRPVTDWIRARWLHCVNIVASDFFLGNDLIRLAIYANQMRAPQLQRQSVDLNSLGNMCKSFRRIGHLLESSKLAIGAGGGVAVARSNGPTPFSPDGISNLFSFFKRFFNL